MELIVSKKVEIKHNMELIQQHIANTLKKYDVVVTEDTVKDTKVLMSNINKDKKDFADKCKMFIAEIEAPIKEFKLNKKSIEDIFDDARFRLAVQVVKFETIKLDEISKVIIQTKVDMCENKGIDQSKVSVEDLIKLSSVTSTGKANKATITAIESRILIIESMIIKQEQDAKEKALRDEAIRLEAIQQERDRVEQKRLDDIAKADAKVKYDLAKGFAEAKTEAAPKTVEVKKEVISDIEQLDISEDSKKIFKVLVEFSVYAPQHILQSAVENKVSSRLNDLGIKDFIIKG